MKEHIRKLSWCQNDIDKLKSLVLSGVRIKQMARDLQRTPSSVNTAMDRYGLRMLRQLKPPAHRRQYFSKKQKACTRQELARKRLAFELPIVVEFHVMEAWLSHQEGVCLQATSYSLAPQNFGFPLLYSLNAQLVPAHRVLMYANELRRAKNLRIFHVEGLTEF